MYNYYLPKFLRVLSKSLKDLSMDLLLESKLFPAFKSILFLQKGQCIVVPTWLSLILISFLHKGQLAEISLLPNVEKNE